MLVMMVVGMTLLGVILYQTDLAEVWGHLVGLGFGGLGAVLHVYLICAFMQVGSWICTLPSVPPTLGRVARLWTVWMVGFSMEATTPLAGLGGEPVKAILLKRRFGVRYAEATTSLVLARTTDMIGQILFIVIGFILMFRSGSLALPYRMAAGSGLAFLVLLTTLFLAAQQQRTLGRIRRWLERGWLGGRALSDRAMATLDALHDIDERLIGFYTTERRRLVVSVGFAFAEWVIGAFAVYIALAYLGHPVTVTEAIVIESFLVLIRSTLFFVPADLGTQEGALALVCGAITGSPELGLALSAVRRTRDIVWIAGGLGIGWIYSVRREEYLAAAAAPEAADDIA